jgi:hypothetical protein
VIGLETLDLASGFLVSVVGLPLALVVVASNPRSRTNQLLGGWLVVGYGSGFINYLWQMVPDERWSYNLALWNYAQLGAILLLYLAFVGTAIATPLVRSFASRTYLWVALLASAGWVGFVCLDPTAFVTNGARNSLGGWSWSEGTQSWIGVFGVAAVVVGAFAMVAAVQAYARAPAGSTRRMQMASYIAAFAVNDLTWVMLGIIELFVPTSVLLDLIDNVLTIIFLGLLARALLRYQLFDFDLKVKWTLQRGTVAAIILGVAVVAAQVAQNYLSGEFGWLAGGVAAGVLVFGIKPIERFAERLSDRAMPRTTGTPEYLAQRKHEIYRAALEDSLADGAVTAKERAVLVRLAQNLGIDGNEALRIEGDVLTSRGDGGA